LDSTDKMIKEETLRKKGWSEEEIKKAMKILGKKRQTFSTDKLMPHVYWISLLLTIVGNLFVSVMMLPFVLYASGISLFVIIGVIAITFGSLFNILLKDIETVDPKHHVIVGIFMPAFALVVVWVIFDLSNNFIKHSGSSIRMNHPIIISAIYSIGFAIPSIMQALAKKR